MEVSGLSDFFVEDGKQLLRIDRFSEDGIHGQGFSMFHFFTEDSNCLLGIAALIQVCFCWRYFVDGKTTPRAQSVFKLIATCGTLTTFFVVLFYLMVLIKDREGEQSNL